MNMANKPQHGHPKRAELPVTRAQSIKSEIASLAYPEKKGFNKFKLVLFVKRSAIFK